MFHSIGRLLDDLQVVLHSDDVPAVASFSNGDDETETHVDIEEGRKRLREAKLRLWMQALVTIFVVAVCGYVVVEQQSTDSAQRLAHTGFGVIIGYWFR